MEHGKILVRNAALTSAIEILTTVLLTARLGLTSVN